MEYNIFKLIPRRLSPWGGDKWGVRGKMQSLSYFALLMFRYAQIENQGTWKLAWVLCKQWSYKCMERKQCYYVWRWLVGRAKEWNRCTLKCCESISKFSYAVVDPLCWLFRDASWYFRCFIDFLGDLCCLREHKLCSYGNGSCIHQLFLFWHLWWFLWHLFLA